MERLSDPITIVLDPGHGGSDCGAVGAGGLTEKAVNLELASRIGTLLASSGVHVIMTRDSDRELTSRSTPAAEELGKRVETARSTDAALFVSLHHNAMADPVAARSARGCTVYYYHQQSLPAALAIARSLAAAIEERRCDVRARSFFVIRQTDMPAVLVEAAFISNPQEEMKLRNPAYLDRAARGICRGILAFIATAGAVPVAETNPGPRGGMP